METRIKRLEDAGLETRDRVTRLETRMDTVATTEQLTEKVGSLTAYISSVKHELKGDIAALRGELKGDIAGLRCELKGDIAGLRCELKGDIAGLRDELKGDIASVTDAMSAMEVRMIKWTVSSVTFASGIAFAAARYIH